MSWILAGVRAYKTGIPKKLVHFFINVGAASITIFLLWLGLVYPVLDCAGFLCGLGELILWIVSSGIILLVWPLVLLVLYRNKGEKPVKRSNDELLDDML